jgi:hypothetical protein
MPSIIRATTTNGLQVAPDNSGSLELQTNGTTTALTIDTSQNVGIGYATPSIFGRFVVQDSGSGNGTITAISSTASNAIYIKNTGTEARFNYNDAYPMTFYINNTERMRINSSGNLLINTTTQLNNSNSYLNILYNGDNFYGSTFKVSTTAGTSIAFVNSSGSGVGSISQTASATAFNTSSDYRLKENIAPMTGALANVLALKPVTYTWKVDGSDGQGFIAHELAEVVPDCVTGEKDAVDADGNPKYQGVDTSFLVATLTAAIQEQQTIINDLKARIETLEAK